MTLFLLPLALPAITVPPAPAEQDLMAPGATMARQVAGTLSAMPQSLRLPEGSSFSALIRYVIDTDGRVNVCGVSRSRVPTSRVEREACEIVRASFRFEPARDAAGVPVAQVRHEWLTWPEPIRSLGPIPLAPGERMPPPDLQTYLATRGERQARLRRGSFEYEELPGIRIEHKVPVGRVEIALNINAAGVVRSCSLLRPSGSALLDDGTCSLALSRTYFYPAQDAAGQPVHSIVKLNIHWVDPPLPPLEAESPDLPVSPVGP